MTKRTFSALLLALCLLLCSCSVSAPGHTETTAPTEYSPTYSAAAAINHCVLEPDDNARLTYKDKIAYRTLMAAMLDRAGSAAPKVDTVTLGDLLDLMRESPYYYFLRSAEIDGDTVRFSYAYSAEEQQEMLDFIDRRILGIANYEASDDDNALDVILKIYLAVTHEMQYDHDRTDNKELDSPLFRYPGDEVYKALRDKKSLCYGFAYVMSNALLQRGIDCFRVYGLCTNRGDGHEWIIFRYGNQFYHCDPTWDRVSNNYAKLIHFGKTDREREVDALDVKNFSSYHDPAYGTVECSDELFRIFRGINRFSYLGGHRYSMTDIKNKNYIFDSSDFSLVEQ